MLMLLSSTLFISFWFEMLRLRFIWSNAVGGHHTCPTIKKKKGFLPSGNCLLFRCIPEALTVICMFFDLFFINLYNFFNQLRPVVFVSKRKVYYRAKRKRVQQRGRESCWDAVVEAKCNVGAGRGRMCFPESLLTVRREKTTKSAYFTFPTMLNAL